MAPTPPSSLRRLGSFCYRRHWLVIGLWVAAIVLVGAFSGAKGTDYQESFDDFDSEATRGFQVMEAFTPPAEEGAPAEERTGQVSARIVFVVDADVEGGVTNPEVREAMDDFFAEAEKIDGGAIRVRSPYDNPLQIASQGDLAGRAAYAELDMPDRTTFTDAGGYAEELRKDLPQVAGLDVKLGGQIFAEFEAPSSEIIGLGFAIVILILAFGSVLAMGLPIGMALSGIAVGVSLVGLASNYLPMPDFTSILAVMLGLGVGIDYALFIVVRFREDLHKGMEPEHAAGHALDTAGRAVLFAGTTVVISVMGMLVMGLGFIRGIGIGSAIAVVCTLVASITLLPALLGLASHRLEVTRRRGLIAAGLVAVSLVATGLGAPVVALPLLGIAVLVLVLGFFLPALQKPLPPRTVKPPRETFWYRYSRVIQHHAWLSAIGGLILLTILAAPVLGLRLGFSDEGNYAEGTDTRDAYDLLADGFGPGFNGQLLLAAELPEGVTDEQLAGITERLGGVDGVAQVLGMAPGLPAEASGAFVSADRTAARWIVTPETAPQDEATETLVRDLRADAITPALEGTGIDDVLVSSQVAIGIDFSDYLGARYPLFFGAVLGLSFLLLMAVFRSILVPLKAVIVNLLSIGAAYGVVVAFFQWGWLSSITGIQPAPIEPFIPMMLFAIVFGLSMDYEVFLLSRIKEEYDRTGNNAEAVADGLAVTARVITAAALIMVVVFGSFLLENDRVVKLMGTGLAMAVLLDATIVRMLLVPATMELLGDRNWWLPKWLDRVLPTIHVEGQPEDADGPDEPAGPSSGAGTGELVGAPS